MDLKMIMWNTALDIAHIESKFDDNGLMPRYISKRLNTLYTALDVLSKQLNVDKALSAIDSLVYDAVVSSDSKPGAGLYASVVSLIDMANRGNEALISDLMAVAREEVVKRRTRKAADA